nr:protein phosphatase 2C domain-containing protein [Leifsonia sp. C5G2]
MSWAALSDTGYRRSVNEDSLLARSPIFAVADGMGGHTAGDFASTAVVTRLAEKVKSDFVGEVALTEALRSAVDDMGRGVGHTDLGTGTTVTGIALTLVDGSPYWLVFNIGDSRVYSYRDGTLEQLTVDHSIVQELLDAGAITPAEAEVHPHSNVITRAVGFNEDPVPDYFLIPIVAGSRLLVCSDGLTKELTEHGIRYFLGEGSSPLDAAQQLMDAALGNGGRDNVTVVVVDVLATPESGAHRDDGSRRAARRH